MSIHVRRILFPLEHRATEKNSGMKAGNAYRHWYQRVFHF